MNAWAGRRRLTPSVTLGVVSALIERNLKLMTRFSVSLAMHYITVFSEALISAFLGKAMIGGAAAASIGGDYVSYAIVGLAYSHMLYTSVSGPLGSLSGAYWSARLEPLLYSPVPLRTLIFADVLWRYVDNLATILIYVLTGWAFGMHVRGGLSLLSASGVLILGCASVLGFGFLSAAMFSLVNAKAPVGDGEPVAWIVRTLQTLVCGVYFPVGVLPRWLRAVSNLMPQTYVLDCVRRLLIPSYPAGQALWLHRVLPWSPQAVDVLGIVTLTAVILPLGLAAFNKGLEKARQDGGLSRWN